jgi:anti-sigma regulatory factor (Ser/Thr protein kinase)
MGSTDNNGPVELEFPAKPEHLADVRKRVEQLAARTPLKRHEIDDFLTAVDEAVANAIRHGSPQGERSKVRVVCRNSPNTLAVEVQDEGNGFSAPSAPAMPSPEAMGGRGLPLMCALADSMEVASSPHGTRVTLQKSLKNGS